MHMGMHLFPQPGAARQKAGMPVDNLRFSTFSTVFSTGVFHRSFSTEICNSVYIRFSSFQNLFSTFPPLVDFAYPEIFVQNFALDSPLRRAPFPEKI